MNELAVLLVGPAAGESHAVDATGALATVADFARLEHVADPRAAIDRLSQADSAFDLIVVAESRPGQVGEASIDALRRLAPLTRVWRLLGSWCEGEQRSARPPAGCTRSYWHQWRQRFARECATLRAGRCPSWGLPLTATADEHALAAADAPRDGRTGQVVVCSDHAEAATALADACRLGGYEPRVTRESAPPGVQIVNAVCVVWDTTVEHACNAVRVAQLRHSAAGAPIVAVIGFPRPQDVQRAIAAGVHGVISKPLAIGDLFWQIAQAHVDSPHRS